MRLYFKLCLMELKLFVREPISLVFTFAFPVVALVVLFGVFGPTATYQFSNAPSNDYYQASYAAVVIAALSLVALPVHVATYRERGVLRRFRASSVPASGVLFAQLVVAMFLAAAGTLLLVFVGTVFYDTTTPVHLGATGIGFGLSALSFLALGYLIGTLARTARTAQAIGMLLFFPMWLLSGAGPPRQFLSDAMQRTADLLPLTYAVRSIQDPWLGRDLPMDSVAVLVVLLVGSVLWSNRSVAQV